MGIFQLGHDPDSPFPPASSASIEPNGLLAWGGDLSCRRLLNAYRNGIFPWYSEGQPLLWWSPDPRTVIFPGGVRIPRRLRRKLRNSDFRVSADRCFQAVITACARERDGGTWITAEMIAAYTELHRQGHAHSLEVWQQERLVGGLYGLALGSAFFAESMFNRVSDASKIALIQLDRLLLKHSFELIDCQMETAHLLGMGAVNIPREDYLRRVKKATDATPSPENWQEWLPCSEIH